MRKCDLFLLTTNFNYQSFMEPVGISILAAIAKKRGLAVEVLEPSILARSVEESTEIILNAKPRVVGISILIDLHIDEILKMIKIIRMSCKDVIIFVGGQAISMNYQQESYAMLIKEVDFFMFGESEYVFGELIEAIINKSNWKKFRGIGYFENGCINTNDAAPMVEDLNELPEMDRSVLREIISNTPSYHETSIPYGRGCSKNCTFCSEVFFRKKSVPKVRRRKLDNVFREMERLYNEYGIRSFNIEDESFLDVDAKEYIELLEFLEKVELLPESVELKILGRIDCISDELTKALYKSGVSYMFLGVDSVVDEDLKLFNKGYSSKMVYEKMDILLKNGYSLEVDSNHRVSTGYITWHPYTTIKGIRESYDFFKKYSNTPKLLQHKLIVFSSTPLIDKIRKDGLLLVDNLPKGSYEYPWKFLHEDVSMLYDYMQRYFKEWTLVRDGIRTIEKYISMEKKEFITESWQIKMYRKQLDHDFYEYFGKILEKTEKQEYEVLELIFNESCNCFQNYVKKIVNNIDNFAKKIEFGLDIQDKLRTNNLWICRYRN